MMDTLAELGDIDAGWFFAATAAGLFAWAAARSRRHRRAPAAAAGPRTPWTWVEDEAGAAAALAAGDALLDEPGHEEQMAAYLHYTRAVQWLSGERGQGSAHRRARMKALFERGREGQAACRPGLTTAALTGPDTD